MSYPIQNIADRTLSQDSKEQIEAAAASMNSMPVGIQAIATAYSELLEEIVMNMPGMFS